MMARALLPPVGTLVLLGLAALLAARAMWLDPNAAVKRGAIGSASTLEPTGREPQLPAGAPATGITTAKFHIAVLDRPLFHPSRRPVTLTPVVQPAVLPAREPEPEPGPVRVLPPPELALRGVLLRGSEQRALLAPPRGEARWFAIGALIHGWQLDEIGEGHVLFRAEDQTHRIGLHE